MTTLHLLTRGYMLRQHVLGMIKAVNVLQRAARKFITSRRAYWTLCVLLLYKAWFAGSCTVSGGLIFFGRSRRGANGIVRDAQSSSKAHGIRSRFAIGFWIYEVQLCDCALQSCVAAAISLHQDDA